MISPSSKSSVRTLLATALAPILLLAASVSSFADEVPKEVLAAQLRKQGYECKTPLKSVREANAQYDDAVWILTCDTGRYRMRLIPDTDAVIEKLAAD